jgi:tetratricopeptide (TPR) repeat protein
LGAVKQFLEWDWIGTDECYTRALELDARLPYVRVWRVSLRAATRQPQEAIAESITAMKLDPDSGVIAYVAAITHYWAGHPDRAADFLELALELEPNAIFATGFALSSFLAKGSAKKVSPQITSNARVGTWCGICPWRALRRRRGAHRRAEEPAARNNTLRRSTLQKFISHSTAHARHATGLSAR